MPPPIACELFDYIEIACMFGYRVTLTLDDNQQITGVPETTRTTKEKQELLVFKAEGDFSSPMEVDTTRLKKMRVLTPGARFEEITFS